MTAGRIGCIVTPRQGNAIPPRALWCADNGCGPGKDGAPGKGWPGARRYDAWLRRRAVDTEVMARCLFAVAPDVVGDARATLRRFTAWAPRLRAYGYPVAFALQDGLERLAVPWDDLDVVFVGGSTSWKLGQHAAAIVGEALTRGKRVHMGRVNSARRYRRALALGSHTADGTFVAKAPDLRLPEALSWSHLAAQGDLLALLDGRASP